MNPSTAVGTRVDDSGAKTVPYDALLAAGLIRKIELKKCSRTHPEMLKNMAVHYSKPLGFVGRSICYLIMFDGVCYGSIAGGSATRFLPGRAVLQSLDNGVNNIFFHIEKRGAYPIREFVPKVLSEYRKSIDRDWESKYGDAVLWHETLVEIPRTGECYKRDGWQLVGQTKGYTCKRTAGKGTDSWSGKRVWDTVNLRPKLVFVHSGHLQDLKQWRLENGI
jgi:hypothetical protein